ncbi:MAG TPA: nickel-dependent lactate racemase [Bryobacteraceae bacterium]|nr:nickel-dependent lactate racemase [Bryobacteraceae bacterium]
MTPSVESVRLAFGREGLCIHLSDDFEHRILACPVVAPLADPHAAIESALDRPFAGPPLFEIARGKRSAAIAVCDITRPVPNRATLPSVLKRLEGAGIPRQGISILIATGLHRAATAAEIREIVGENVAQCYTVLNHDARNAALHRALGATSSGTTFAIDARFLDADLHITLGLIEPHLMLGFSGGRKLIAPGLASEATIKQLHSPRFMRDGRTREGFIDDNPLHADLLEIARAARQDFMLDVVPTRDRGIAAVFAGEPEASHAAGMKWVAAATMQRLDAPVDAVITTSAGYPLDLTFYQCIKGVTAASQIVKQGGRILLFGASSEGAGASEFREMLTRYRSAQDFMDATAGAPVTIDQWQLEKLALAVKKAKVFYCVPGLPAEQRNALWGPAFDCAENALRAFYQDLPRGSRIAVIPEGPYVLAGVR